MSRRRAAFCAARDANGNADWTPNRGVSDPEIARDCIPARHDKGRSRHGLAVGCQRGRRRVVMVATALAIIWQQRVVHDAWRPATARESMALCSAVSRRGRHCAS